MPVGDPLRFQQTERRASEAAKLENWVEHLLRRQMLDEFQTGIDRHAKTSVPAVVPTRAFQIYECLLGSG